MVDRHIGTTSWSYRETFPWFTMPVFTDAWLADAKYLDSTGSVGTWLPQKGVIQLVQATGGFKPTYSASWGSKNRGSLLFDGVDDLLSGDALAAKTTGNQSYTLIASFAALTIAAQRVAWSFSDASNVVDAGGLQIGPEAGNPWRVPLTDHAGHLQENYSDFPVNTANVVVTYIFDGTAVGSPASRIRVNGTERLVIKAQVGTIGTTTFSKFTVGAFRGSSTISLMNMRLRGLLFAPSIAPTAQVAICENYLISEAA